MSKYTTEVRFICEESAGLDESVGYDSIDKVIKDAREKVFDFDFPIFDENYRAVLETKILKHYYTREIGFETAALWKHFLCTRLNEIMPYYNKLYNSELIQFNPMYDVDLTTNYQKVGSENSDKVSDFDEQMLSSGNKNKNETTNEKTDYGTISEQEANRNKNQTATENSNSAESGHSYTDNHDDNKNDHWEYFSDTPEGGINGLADGAVGDMNYLTTATHITDDKAGSTSSSEVNNDKSNSSVKAGNTISSETDNIVGNEVGTSNKDRNKASDENSTNSTTKNGTTTSNEVINNIEDYLHHVVGKTGGTSYSKMLEEYRKTFLNIDMLIINNLSDLFLNLW